MCHQSANARRFANTVERKMVKTTDNDNLPAKSVGTVSDGTHLKKTFDTVSKGYDGHALRFFPKSAEHLAAFLNLEGNETVMDIATGTGHAALAIARYLPLGRVVGIDFSEGMLDEARKKATARSIDNIEFIEGDMRFLNLPNDYFDIAVCSFGIFFVDDMKSQLIRIASLVKPGGTVAISSFQDGYFAPMSDMMFDRLADYGIEKTPQTWKNIATEEGCRCLFEGARLQKIRVEKLNVGYYLNSAEEWWYVLWNGGYRRLLSQLPPVVLEKFKKEHLREIEALRTRDGIWLDVGVIFTAGEKPKKADFNDESRP